MVHTGDSIMSETHELVGTVTVTSKNLAGPVDLKEIECGRHYVMVEVGENYCSRCGEEL